ncbi:MAG: isoprenylcysteine carboxylmethyltransferase family protein [Acidobacteria bacterium]|nr:isoprenylcysteine carboxylmethyltransferase family protein [Acidobacteriota bacterium]
MARTSPGVRFPPLLIYVIGYGIGRLIERALPLPILPGGRNVVMTVFGWLLIVSSLIFVTAALIIFRRHKTGIYPTQPASTIVRSGPYRYTRNPMYVGMTATYAGISLLTNMLWPLLVLPILIAILQSTVIRREESYLREAFGDAYESYCREVRRWI